MKKGGAGFVVKMILLIFCFLGVCSMLGSFGVYTAYKYQQSTCSGLTSGTVVEMAPHLSRSSRGSATGHRSITLYAPVVQFEVDGKEYVIESNSAQYPPAYEIGDSVDVHYNPDNPEEVYFDSNTAVTMVAVIFGVIGVAFIVIPVIFLFLARKVGMV